MARYYNSWQSEVKSTFAPLPLELIQQTLNQKQAENDYLEGQLEGDLNLVYDPELVNSEDVMNKRNNYLTELNNVRQTLNTSYDLSSVAKQIRDIQQNYGIVLNNPMSYTGGSSTTGGSGSGTSSSGTKRNVGSSQEYGNIPYTYGTPEFINWYNLDERLNKEELYNKNNSSDAPYYKFMNIDREVARQRSNTNGDFNRQEMMNYKYEEPYDTNKTDSELSSMASGWNANGSSGSYVIKGGELAGYIETYHKTGIEGGPQSEIYQSMYGKMMNDNGWIRHNEVMYYNMLENQEYAQYNPDAYNNYADFFLQNEAIKNLKVKGISQNNPNYQSYLQKEMIEIQDKFVNGYYEAAKTNQNLDPNISKEEILDRQRREVWGLQGYTMTNTDELITPYVNSASFEDRTSSVKESEQLKFGYSKALEDYKLGLQNKAQVTGQNIKLNVSTPEKRKEVIKTVMDRKNNLESNMINSRTLLANQENTLLGLLGNTLNTLQQPYKPNIGNSLFNPVSKTQNQMNLNSQLELLNTQGLIVKKSDGSYEMQGNLDSWKKAGYDISVEELQSINNGLADYNEASSNYNQSQTQYNQNQIQTKNFVTIFENDKTESDKFWKELYSIYMYNFRYADEKNIKYKTIEDFKKGIKEGKDLDLSKFTDKYNKKISEYISEKGNETYQIAEYSYGDTYGKGQQFGPMRTIDELYSSPDVLNTFKDYGSGKTYWELAGIKQEDMNKFKFTTQLVPMTNQSGTTMYGLKVTATPKSGTTIDKDHPIQNINMIVSYDDIKEVSAGYDPSGAIINASIGVLQNLDNDPTGGVYIQQVNRDNAWVNMRIVGENVMAQQGKNKHFNNETGNSFTQSYVNSVPKGQFYPVPVYTNSDGNEYYIKNENGKGVLYMKNNNGGYENAMIPNTSGGIGVNAIESYDDLDVVVGYNEFITNDSWNPSIGGNSYYKPYVNQQ